MVWGSGSSRITWTDFFVKIIHLNLDSAGIWNRLKYSIVSVSNKGQLHRIDPSSHRECGQFRPCIHENFEKFEMISTPTGSWIRSRRRRDRIQLPVGVEIISNFSKFSWIQGRNCPHSRDRSQLPGRRRNHHVTQSPPKQDPVMPKKRSKSVIASESKPSFSLAPMRHARALRSEESDAVDPLICECRAWPSGEGLNEQRKLKMIP